MPFILITNYPPLYLYEIGGWLSIKIKQIFELNSFLLWNAHRMKQNSDIEI